MLTNPLGQSELAVCLRSAEGVALGDVFSFLSALYFRGKLTYARACAPEARIRVITTSRGLVSPSLAIRDHDLDEFGSVDIDVEDPRYVEPLRRTTEEFAAALPDSTCVVLLGSIATGKYVDTLVSIFGERLLFPAEFVGRGDMSRGGLLLRHARAGTQLEYASLIRAERRGKRPAKLGKPPRRSD